MRPHGAQGVLRTSKSAPGRFVPPAGAGACPVLDTGTESVAGTTVEGQIVRTDDLHGDSRPLGCGQSLPPGLQHTGAGSACCKQGDGRNEHVPAGGKKTSDGASSAVCDVDVVSRLP